MFTEAQLAKTSDATSNTVVTWSFMAFLNAKFRERSQSFRASSDLKSLAFEVIQSPALFSANWINQLFTNRSELIARQKIYAHAARWPVRQDPFSSHCRSASRQIITADVSDCYAEDTFPAASVLALNP